MSFGNNLKRIRINNNMSQEKFAELLGVSRQAVSIWESDAGYPEVEKLLDIAEILNISLDYLFYGKERETVTNKSSDGKISIFSPVENVIVRCSNVASTQQFKGQATEPEYALFAEDENNTSFMSSKSQILMGWYKNKDELSKEVEEIYKALTKGQNSYVIKYAIPVKRKGIRIEIINNK